MPTKLHEWVISSVVKELQCQLRELGGGQNPSSAFARAVDLRGSPTLTFPDPGYGRHDPNALFRHLDEPYPRVVIEVSYTQKRKDLAAIAKNYIIGSNGDIGVVIGLDVKYHSSKQANHTILELFYCTLPKQFQ